MPSKHYRYGGSTIARTLACPPWVHEADKAPKIPRQSSDASRGTALHYCMEQCYTGDLTPEYWLDKHVTEGDYTITADDVEQMRIAYDAAEAVLDEYNIDLVICEPTMQYADDVGGSADMLGVSDDYRLVLDWKFGYQEVKAHMQGVFYDMCALETQSWYGATAPTTLLVVTVQPAVSDKADVREFEMAEAMKMQGQMMSAIAISREGEGELSAGAHCQYCPAAPYCPAKRKQSTHFLTLDPHNRAQLVEAMEMVEAMKEQIKVVEAETFAVLKNDEKVPGWKLVEKQKRRYWKDETAVERMLMKLPDSLTHDMKLKSVAQLEKSLKTKHADLLEKISEQIDNRSSGLTIAPESDKRPAVPGMNQTPAALDNLMKAAS